MRDYVHWSVLGALCDFLPLPDNRVTLDAETDRHGCPTQGSANPALTIMAMAARVADHMLGRVRPWTG